MANTNIREASVSDAAFILQCIKDLAEYEKAPHEVTATVDDIKNTIFCENPKAFALILEADGKPVGFTVYFYNYSTWKGCHGIYIEDVYVQPEYRRFGLGKAVFEYLSQKAVAEGCARVEWWVLNWNEPAINFYKKIGAEAMTEWTVQRLSGESLSTMANQSTHMKKAS